MVDPSTILQMKQLDNALGNPFDKFREFQGNAYEKANGLVKDGEAVLRDNLMAAIPGAAALAAVAGNGGGNVDVVKNVMLAKKVAYLTSAIAGVSIFVLIMWLIFRKKKPQGVGEGEKEEEFLGTSPSKTTKWAIGIVISVLLGVGFLTVISTKKSSSVKSSTIPRYTQYQMK